MEKISNWFMQALSTVLAWFYALTGGALVLPVPIQITAGPAVMIVSESEYAVMWATNRKGTGSVVVTKDGEALAFNDTGSGTLRSDDTLHVARVPKAVLDACDTYRVESQYVLFNMGYFAFVGGKASSAERAFRSYAGQEEIRALFFTDVHDDRAQAMRNAAALTQDAPADLVIFAGDLCELKVQKDFVNGIVGLAASMSGGTIPVLYCRGNHETRGQWATEMRRYFPTRTGEMYYTADYGPISFTVLDTGEDKQDDHQEYFGMADFAAYRAQEDAWLRALTQAPGYDYRVCVSHTNNLDRAGFYDNWYLPLRDNLGVTHVFCGHGHRNQAWVSNDVQCYEDGGPNTGSLLVFRNGGIYAYSVASPGEIQDFGKLG